MRPTFPPLRRVPVRPSQQAVTPVPQVFRVDANTGRASGGTLVTIYGAGFRKNSDGSAPSVTFDGVSATSVVLVDSGTLTCLTPVVNASGLVDVIVTCGSQSGTGVGVFTFVEPVITRVTPGFGPFGGNTNVLIEGYNFQAGSSVLFDDELALNIVVVDSQNITCKTPPHATGFVDVVIVEPTA